MESTHHQNLRVAYFISSQGIGATFHLCHLAIELAERGAFDYLFVSDTIEQNPGLLTATGERVENLLLYTGLEQKGKRFRAALDCIRELRRARPDLVHSQTNFQLLLAILVCAFRPARVVHTVHAFRNSRGGWRMHCHRLLLQAVCRLFVWRVFVPSRFVQDALPSLGGKRRLLHLGYPDPGDIPTGAPMATPPRIIYCAKYHAAKNHAWLIDTLEERITAGRLRLLLPGDGVEWHSLRQRVRASPQLARGIEMPGWLPQAEIQNLYRQADIAVVPSGSESFGHNIVEPLGFGLPVIAFPVGVARELAGTPALRCIDFFDAGALLEGLDAWIANPLRYREAREEALRLFRSRFSWANHVAEYEGTLWEW